MRSLVVLTLVVVAATLATGQQPPTTTDVPARYGIPPRLKTYPQNSPKEALASVIEAVEKNDTAYLLAHLLDPGFVDGRVGDRAKQYEPMVEMQLAKTRDEQRGMLGTIDPDLRIPLDAAGFKAAVAREAQAQAFRQVVSDTKDKFADDPTTLKTLRRFLREGTFADAGDTSRAGLADVKDQAVFFKKIGERWFVENRQTEEAPKKP